MKNSMKNLVLAGALLLHALSISGCGTLYMNAPPGADIKLLSRDAPATVKIEKHIWFKWWGGQPLHPEEAHAASIIKDAGLREARIRMTNTLADGLYSIIPGVFGFPRRTMIVEGNRDITPAPRPLSRPWIPILAA